MRRDEPSNADDVIDSRSIIERFEELDSEQSELVEEYTEARDEAEEDEEAEGVTERLANAINALADYWGIAPEEVADSVAALDNDADSFNGNEELHALRKLIEEASAYSEDWDYGATLIRESYFTEYARELVSDIGDMPKEIPSYIVIDWDATADNIRQDYTEVDFDGVTYLVR